MMADPDRARSILMFGSGRKTFLATSHAGRGGFVGILQGMVGRPAIDKASLKDLFEIRLEFPLDASFAPGTDAQPGPDIPSLRAVLQDQLGLRP